MVIDYNTGVLIVITVDTNSNLSYISVTIRDFEKRGRPENCCKCNGDTSVGLIERSQ